MPNREKFDRIQGVETMAKKKKTTLLATLTLQGILCKTSGAEEQNLLGLLLTAPADQLAASQWEVVVLAEATYQGMWRRGCWASVSYYIADKVMNEDELQEIHLRVLLGDTQVGYGAHYSDLTGYLWTDEDFVVGGHDLIKEWRGLLGKFLYMKAEFHSEVPKGKGEHGL